MRPIDADALYDRLSSFTGMFADEIGFAVNLNHVLDCIVNKFVTDAFVEKEYAKIVNDNNGWSSRMIPQLLNKVYHELICEEMWNILKVFRNPAINFKALNNFVIARVKAIKPELF